MDLVEVLSFLFMLSTMELGRVSHTILVVVIATDAGERRFDTRNIPQTR